MSLTISSGSTYTIAPLLPELLSLLISVLLLGISPNISATADGPVPLQLVGAAIPLVVEADLHQVSPASTLNVYLPGFNPFIS